MRVLFSTTAGAGHFGPMIPVAHACAAAGHEVAVAAPASFADTVLGSGLRHLPFPDVPPDQLGSVFARVEELPREEGNRVVVTEVFGRLDAQAALPTLMNIVEDMRPDVVVRDPCEFGSLVAAERAGTPQVQVAISMDAFVVAIADWLEEPLRELESIAGLDCARGAELILDTPTITSVPAVLDAAATADGADVRGRRSWRFRNERAPQGAALPGNWGDPFAPLVYVSFGSVAGSLGRFASLYSDVLDALADQPVRVLMTTGTGLDPAQLHPVPANASVLPWWPQEAAMREASLLIGHGGFGTTMTAVGAGVPQIVMPLFASDQFLNAERIHDAGVGIQLDGGLDAVDSVSAAVREVLEHAAYADAARSVAAEIAAMPEVAQSVLVLQELASAR